MEDFGECYNVYRTQLKNTSDDFQAERETNMSAVLAALEMNDCPDADKVSAHTPQETWLLSLVLVSSNILVGLHMILCLVFLQPGQS